MGHPPGHSEKNLVCSKNGECDQSVSQSQFIQHHIITNISRQYPKNINRSVMRLSRHCSKERLPNSPTINCKGCLNSVNAYVEWNYTFVFVRPYFDVTKIKQYMISFRYKYTSQNSSCFYEASVLVPLNLTNVYSSLCMLWFAVQLSVDPQKISRSTCSALSNSCHL